MRAMNQSIQMALNQLMRHRTPLLIIWFYHEYCGFNDIGIWEGLDIRLLDVGLKTQHDNF